MHQNNVFWTTYHPWSSSMRKTEPQQLIATFGRAAFFTHWALKTSKSSSLSRCWKAALTRGCSRFKYCIKDESLLDNTEFIQIIWSSMTEENVVNTKPCSVCPSIHPWSLFTSFNKLHNFTLLTKPPVAIVPEPSRWPLTESLCRKLKRINYTKLNRTVIFKSTSDTVMGSSEAQTTFLQH